MTPTTPGAEQHRTLTPVQLVCQYQQPAKISPTSPKNTGAPRRQEVGACDRGEGQPPLGAGPGVVWVVGSIQSGRAARGDPRLGARCRSRAARSGLSQNRPPLFQTHPAEDTLPLPGSPRIHPRRSGRTRTPGFVRSRRFEGAIGASPTAIFQRRHRPAGTHHASHLRPRSWLLWRGCSSLSDALHEDIGFVRGNASRLRRRRSRVLPAVFTGLKVHEDSGQHPRWRSTPVEVAERRDIQGMTRRRPNEPWPPRTALGAARPHDHLLSPRSAGGRGRMPASARRGVLASPNLTPGPPVAAPIDEHRLEVPTPPPRPGHRR